MGFKEWLKPRVLISAGAGLLLAFVISGLSVTKIVATTCRTSKEPIWIDLTNTSDNFSTPVCKGQKVGWRSTEQFTVTFDNNNKCVDPRMYTVDQTCPGPATTPPTKCSDTTHVKQPSALGIGWCDYKVGGGLTDPRVIIIGN